MKSCSSCEFLGYDGNRHFCKALTKSNPSKELIHDAPVDIGADYGDLPYMYIEDPEEFGCSLHPDNELVTDS